LLGELHVTQLAATGLTVARMPASGAPAQESGGFALPVLPVSIRLDALRIGNVALGAAPAEEGATGMLARLDADGHLVWTPSFLDLTLTAGRRDGVEGGLSALVLIDRHGKRVNIRVSGHDGARGRPGLAARLSGLEIPGRAAIEAEAQSLDGRIAATLHLDGGTDVKLDASAQGLWAAMLDLDFSIGAKGALVARALTDIGAPREMQARGKLRWQADDMLVLSGMDFTAGALALKGEASLARISSARPHDMRGEGTLAGLDQLLGMPGNAALTPLGWRIAGALDRSAGTARIAEAFLKAPAAEGQFAGEIGFDGAARGEA